jgi:hypothetical protein
MAATSTTSILISAPATSMSSASARRRRISPRAGHALEILGHAIEYLTDEFVHRGVPVSSNGTQLQAVQLLMALNRQVYFECPEVPSLSERLRAFLHLNSL